METIADNSQNKNLVKNLKCKCSMCGESLTAPIFFNGEIYGFTCIKKVNPSFRQRKAHFVVADSFSVNIDCDGNKLINAIYQGSNQKPLSFLGAIKNLKFSDGTPYIQTNGIELVDNIAYIDLLKYNKGIF